VKLVKVRFNFGKLKCNQHDHAKALRMVDLLEPIRQRQAANPEGGRTRALWYKRLWFYFPSGACWNLDIALVRSL
jgi:hypothetical protein